MNYVKANRRGSREAELENSTGFNVYIRYTSLKKHILESLNTKINMNKIFYSIRNMFIRKTNLMKWINKMFKNAQKREWYETYWAIDIHGTNISMFY